MSFSAQELVADYVIVGAGAVGLSFLDVLLDHTDSDVILIDRRGEPGGHWRDAYPFVRLHNVSALYGVNSRRLGADRVTRGGPEAGFMERATLPEILDYYDAFFREKVLASGRVLWLGRHEWRKGGRAHSLEGGAEVKLRARRRVIDATFTDTRVPSTHGPGFDVAAGVRCISPNALPNAVDGGARYTIIGTGKTGMDCVSFLLEAGVDPEAIAWVRPREPWLLNRAYWQPNDASFVTTMAGFALDLEAVASAGSVDEYFLRLEDAGLVHRIDRDTAPTMFRCAIASTSEIAQWRRVRNVIRKGRVREIAPDRMRLDGGDVAARPGEIYVHCTADGVPRRETRPIFEAGRVTPQFVRRCGPVFSAALIARVESLDVSDEHKNALCEVVAMVDAPIDWVRAHIVEIDNRARWARVPELRDWLERSRLDAYTAMNARVMRAATPQQAAAFERWRQARAPARARMAQLVSA